jgi:hypothetical protein
MRILWIRIRNPKTGCGTTNLVHFSQNNENLGCATTNLAHLSQGYGNLDWATSNLVHFHLTMEILIAQFGN